MTPPGGRRPTPILTFPRKGGRDPLQGFLKWAPSPLAREGWDGGEFFRPHSFHRRHLLQWGSRLIAVTMFVIPNLSLGAENAAGDLTKTKQEGLKVVTEHDNRDRGFKNFSAELTMILENRHGQESRRRMSSKTLEQQQDGDKTLIVFKEPRDVKGTALTYLHPQSGCRRPVVVSTSIKTRETYRLNE